MVATLPRVTICNSRLTLSAPLAYFPLGMLRALTSRSAAERLAVATEFVRSFSPATELLVIGRT